MNIKANTNIFTTKFQQKFIMQNNILRISKIQNVINHLVIP